MINILVNNQFVDLPSVDGLPLNVTIEIDDFEKLTGSKDGGSITNSLSSLVLPPTNRNTRILNFADIATIKDGIEHLLVDLKLLKFGQTIFSGKAYVKKVQRGFNFTEAFELDVKGANASLWAKIEGVKLNQLDMGTVVYDDVTIRTSMSNAGFLNRNYIFAPVTYGYAQYEQNPLDTDPTKGLIFAWSDIKPHLYITQILKNLIEKYAGYRLNSNFLDTDFARSLVMISSAGALKTKGVENSVFARAKRGNPDSWLYFSTGDMPSIPNERQYKHYRNLEGWGVGFDETDMELQGITHQTVTEPHPVQTQLSTTYSVFTVPVSGVYEIEADLSVICDIHEQFLESFPIHPVKYPANTDVPIDYDASGLKKPYAHFTVVTVNNGLNENSINANIFNQKIPQTSTNIPYSVLTNPYYKYFENYKISNDVHIFRANTGTGDFNNTQYLGRPIPPDGGTRKVRVNMAAGGKITIMSYFQRLQISSSNPIPAMPVMAEGTYINITLVEEPTYGSVLDLASCLPDKNAKDLIKSLNQMFGLVWRVDDIRKTVRVEPRFDYYLRNYAGPTQAPVRYEGFYKYRPNTLVKHQEAFEKIDGEDVDIEFRDVYGKELKMRYKEGNDPAIDWIKQRNADNKNSYLPFSCSTTLYDRGKNGTDSQNTIFTDLVLGFTSVNNTRYGALPMCLPSSADLIKDRVLPKATFKCDPKIASVFWNYARIKYSDIALDSNNPYTARKGDVNPVTGLKYCDYLSAPFLHQGANIDSHAIVSDTNPIPLTPQDSGVYFSVMDLQNANKIRANGYWCITYNDTAQLVSVVRNSNLSTSAVTRTVTGTEVRYGLVSSFWQTYLATIKHGSFITTNAYVTPFGMSQFDNSIIYRVQVGDRLIYAIILTVKNYKPTQDEDVQLEMVEVILNRKALDGTYYVNLVSTEPKDSFVIHLNKKGD